MKLDPIAAAIVSVFAACALAQGPPPVSAARSNTFIALVTQLNTGLNAKKLKIGDKVTATVIQDLILGGKVVIPRDSKLIGHIVEVEALTKTDPRSRLALVFESAKIKEGGAIRLHGVIQALAPPLPDPFLEAVMSSSSPYSAEENGHPVNGAIMSAGQTNATTSITADPRQSGARALEQREQALESAGQPRNGGAGPHGALTAGSHGIFGLPGLFLSNAYAVPAIVSVGQNVELKSGTQVVLRLDHAGSLL